MPPELKRTLSPFLILFYGLGTILGAGIYVLIGEVAATAGMYTPLSFLIAAIIACFSAFSFAELSSRFPQSAGEALYTHAAFGNKILSTIIGIMVTAIGIVSAATLSHGFTGYLQVFIDCPDWLALTCLILSLGLIACWGISESVTTVSVMTALELFGLLYILWIGADALHTLPARLPEMIPRSFSVWPSVFSGAFLAFYAYVGFEDMVNVAEEVKNPEKTMPTAIICCLCITTVLYITVALVAVLSLPMESLAGSDAPLAIIYQYTTGNYPILIALISLVAITNGALVQIIMGSRVLYGLSVQGWLPAFFGCINPRTQTPLQATVFLTLLILGMALWMPLVTLARLTSFITLVVFACINLALWVIKRRQLHPVECFEVPAWVPVTGFGICCAMILQELARIFF